MDPCPFVRILIGSLALKLPSPSNPSSSSPCFCKIKLRNFPSQITSIPLISNHDSPIPALAFASFNLNKSQFDKLVKKSSSTVGKSHCLKVEIYGGKRGFTCGLSGYGKLLGTFLVPLECVKAAEYRTCVIQNGWVSNGGGGGVAKGSSSSSIELHLNVKAEPDPRFVFLFDGEPECSPQVFQINGNIRQPVFTCQFSFGNSGELSLRSRYSLSDSSSSKSWLSFLRRANTEEPTKERKGWSVTIHDLSGSPVAAASMVTPFVPSPGTNRVSRSNPGAWLVLRPGNGTWKPWGRLEAWRERTAGHLLGYQFQLLPDDAAGWPDSVAVANSTLSTKNGGKFTLEINTGASSPASTPSSSFDFGSGSLSGSEIGSGSWGQFMYRGFVMSSTVEGGGRCSMPEVQVGVQHVTCTEDAAAFVALAAAVDLSMDACIPFSRKLRKELRQRNQESVV